MINHLFLQGSFKGCPIDEIFLTDKVRNFNFVIPVKKYKGIQVQNEISVIELHQYETEEVEYDFYSRRLSIKECFGSLYKDVSTAGYILPKAWVVWSIYNQENLISLYNRYIQFGLNIFNYDPPIIIGNSDKTTEEDFYQWLYWDDDLGSVIQIDQEKLLYYSYSFNMKQVSCLMLGITEDIYDSEMINRGGLPALIDLKPEEDEKLWEEQLKLYEDIMIIHVNNTSNITSIIDKYQLDDLDHLLAKSNEIDEDLVSEPEIEDEGDEGDLMLDELNRIDIEESGIDFFSLGYFDNS